MDSYYQYGNTIRLKANFKDFNGVVFVPDLVRLIIYDRMWNQLDVISLSVTNQDENGSFYTDYVFDEVGTYFYEWYGETGGMPVLERNKIVMKHI